MGSLSPSRVWAMRLTYVALALVVLFFHLLPLDTQPRKWAPPDLLVALTFAWALRRPDFVPIPLVALVFLGADLLLQRPPGLWAALVVGGCAYVTNRRSNPGETAFAGEWLMVGIVLVGIAVVNRAVLGLTGVETAPLLLSLSQTLLTVAVYPLVVLLSQALFGVRRLAPSDADAMAGRT